MLATYMAVSEPTAPPPMMTMFSPSGSCLALQDVPGHDHVGAVDARDGRDRLARRRWRPPRRRSPRLASSSGVASVSRNSSTPASSSCTSRSSTAVQNSSRPGGTAARLSCPPSTSLFSNRVTAWPRSAAVMAAFMPAGPPPTTATRLALPGSLQPCTPVRARRGG